MSNRVSYKIKNWRKYNRSLIARGNITLWFDENSLSQWYHQKKNKGAKRGRPCVYSNTCIELSLTLRSLFHLPLRGTQGFLEGMMSLLGLDLCVPNYTSLSRRASNLELQLKRIKHSRSIDIVVDSTGLKIYGEGEWKIRTHGKSKRRTWRKLHLATDPGRHEIVAVQLTLATVSDDSVMPNLMKEQKKIGNVYADGAYISKRCFDSIATARGTPVIAIRSGTGLVKNPSPGQSLRNELVKEIWEAGGKTIWKKTSTYHRRSLAETTMFRFKTILGNKLSSRTLDNQITEATIKANILNRMTGLGMPKSYKVC